MITAYDDVFRDQWDLLLLKLWLHLNVSLFMVVLNLYYISETHSQQ